MREFLGSLPEDLRYLLLCAGSGKGHLCRAASLALKHGATDLARQLYLGAWLGDPFDPVTSQGLLDFEARWPGLAVSQLKALKLGAALNARPARETWLAALENGNPEQAMLDRLEGELAAEPGNGRLAGALVHFCFTTGDCPRIIRSCKGFEGFAALVPAISGLAGEAWLQAGEPLAAYERFATAESVFPGYYLDRMAECLWLAGRESEALELLARAVRTLPWRVNAALRLHDLFTGLAGRKLALPGRLAILLYSFKAPEKLKVSLESLGRSDFSLAQGVSVQVLLNGPDADSQALLESIGGSIGAGARIEHLVLPVNVGAAAARNWLMSLPQTSASDYVGFLDDDVRLPGDWLGYFGSAFAAYPGAALAGCKVCDFGLPSRTQQADTNLLAAREGEPVFSLSEAQINDFRPERYAYLRPSLSVTGCCHVFRQAALYACGDFDIRFSPTQFDDLDHDLRMGLNGERTVYQGHLTVEHMQVSGRGLQKSPSAKANATANLYKLKSKYSEPEISGLRSKALVELERDLQAKLASLDTSGIIKI